MNERLTIEQWIKILEDHARYTPIVLFDIDMWRYKGKRIIFKENYVLLFDKCEYCGVNSLNKNYICNACGAPA
jgi:hypothetical protein